MSYYIVAFRNLACSSVFGVFDLVIGKMCNCKAAKI